MGEICPNCQDTGIDKKTGLTCACRLRAYYKRLGSYTKVGKPSAIAKQFVHKMLKENELSRYFIIDTGIHIEQTPLRQWFDQLIAYYLFMSGKVLSYKKFQMDFLINLYMGQANEGIPEDEKINIYSLSHKTIIIDYVDSVHKVLPMQVMNILLDYYADRNFFIYISNKGKDIFNDLNYRTDLKTIWRKN